MGFRKISTKNEYVSTCVPRLEFHRIAMSMSWKLPRLLRLAAVSAQKLVAEFTKVPDDTKTSER